MRPLSRTSGRAALSALALGLALFSVARAQDEGFGQQGLIQGAVARCVNGVETPASNVDVGIEGGSSRLARTGDDGGFFLSLPPGTYTITATAPDGFASRPYVPVEAGSGLPLDIGILDIGGGVAGCGLPEDVTAPALPTFTPTAVATAVAPTPTPPPPPTATPVPAPAPAPADQAPATDGVPTEEMPADGSPGSAG